MTNEYEKYVNDILNRYGFNKIRLDDEEEEKETKTHGEQLNQQILELIRLLRQ